MRRMTIAATAHPVRLSAATELLSVIEYGPELDPTTWSTATEEMIEIDPHDTTEDVTVTIPASSPTLFVRLKSEPVAP